MVRTTSVSEQNSPLGKHQGLGEACAQVMEGGRGQCLLSHSSSYSRALGPIPRGQVEGQWAVEAGFLEKWSPNVVGGISTLASCYA